MLLALCLWGVCAADYSTLGLFDRAGQLPGAKKKNEARERDGLAALGYGAGQSSPLYL
jgi:hypothetical protein